MEEHSFNFFELSLFTEVKLFLFNRKVTENYLYLGKFDYYPWGVYCDGIFFERINGYLSRRFEKHLNSKNLDWVQRHTYPTQSGQEKCGHRHFFSCLNSGNIVALKDFSSFIDIVDSEKIEDFDNRMAELEKKDFYSPVDKSKDEYVPYTYDAFLRHLNSERWGFTSYALIGENEITSVFFMKYDDLCIVGAPWDEGIHKEEFSRRYNKFNPKEHFSFNLIQYVTNLKLNCRIHCEDTVAVMSPQEAYEAFKLVTVNKYLRNGTLYAENY